MDLYKEILIQALEGERVQVHFPGLTWSAAELVESKCYIALEKIKQILQDDRLEDSECFEKIEAIVSVLEGMGSSGGGRHDFG